MILAYVNKAKLFILTTDAGNYAIAAILSQINEKNEEQKVSLSCSDHMFFSLSSLIIGIAIIYVCISVIIRRGM